MQVVDCNVAIGGDVRMVVRKRNVSIPELVVLQKVHGRDAIRDIDVVGEARRFSPVAERERLKIKYELTEQSPKIDSLFPGVKPQMPSRLDEIVLVDDIDADQDERTGKPLEVVRFDENQRPRRAGTAPVILDGPGDALDDDTDIDPPELELPEGVDGPTPAEGEPSATPAPASGEAGQSTVAAMFD